MSRRSGGRRLLTLLSGGKPSWLLRGDGLASTLDIDFVNDRAWNGGPTTISSLLTCTRASSGYYTNADGTLQSFGSNVLRYGTNGLLVEEARTNLFLRSQEFDSGLVWTSLTGAYLCTANATAAPDGTTTADKIIPTAAVANHDTLQTVTAAAVTYTISVYAKTAEYNWVHFTYFDGSVDRQAFFNTTTGAAGTTSAGVTTHVQALADGWYRFAMTFTGAVGQDTFGFGAAVADNNRSGAGDGTSGIYAWGAQVEAGSFPTSYIPTTSSSATRAADVVKIDPITSLGTVVPGTVYCHTEIIDPTNPHRVWQFNASDSGDYIDIFVQSDIWNSIIGGFGSDAAVAGTHKTAYGYANGAQGFSLNGNSRSMSQAITAVPNRLQIGNSSGSGQFLGAYMKRIAYWNSRLSNSALQALTA